MKLYYVEYITNETWYRWVSSNGNSYYDSYDGAKRAANYITKMYSKWYSNVGVKIYSIESAPVLEFQKSVAK